MWLLFTLVFVCTACPHQVAIIDDDATYLKRTAGMWVSDLGNSDEKVRRAAAFALSKMGKHAVPYLREIRAALERESAISVRISLANCLGELGPLASSEVVDIIMQRWKTEREVSVQRALVTALGKLGEAGRAAESLLAQSLESRDGPLAQQAVWSLGQLGQVSEPTLLKLMKLGTSDQSSIRCEVMSALGNLGPAALEGLPVLLRGLSDTNATVQEQSVLALRKMGPAASKSILPLISLAEDARAEPGLRQAALLSLESVWSTGLKEPAAWHRLQSLATVAIPESVRVSAMQAEKKIAPLRK